ncbi:hypothetical protein CTAYLR_002509 [Chrysophaeum taylorii]|uniref:Activator of Hsp90 ATPase AHSA1-like N-terminal domain-containing protein n=1 Tax=Chrysophaeum taylorii TaxID=2483200 RepID=A0AAD7UF08_9STRA|nr:hypothetical protein CTAYLR_002509 [Chrysophaeum taylorii]
MAENVSRESWHWQEVDLKDWVRKWLDANFAEVVLVELEAVKIKATEAYVDNGEVLIHARKGGEYFATYNLGLVVKWYAQKRLDGRVLGEARGRVRFPEFSNGGIEDPLVEGDWQYQKPLGGPIALNEQEKKGYDISEVEKDLKDEVAARAIGPLRTRLERLGEDVRGVAAGYHRNAKLREPQNLKGLPEFDHCGPALRAEASTRQLLVDMKSKLRSSDFEARCDEVRDGTRAQGDFRCMSLTDADIPAIVAALPRDTHRASSITSLDLSYNDITDAGIQHVMCALATGAAPHLKHLRLDHTKITSLSRRQLFDGLKVLRRGLEIDAATTFSEKTLAERAKSVVDSSRHLGDLLGVSLETDVSLVANVSFTPMQRVALTSNGNFQRVLSSYHNRPVQIRVIRNEKVGPGLYERAVVLSCRERPCCVAQSVVATQPAASELVDSGAIGIGQLFERLGELPKFSLIEVAKNERTISRVYTLASAHVACYIEEVMPLDLFDEGFLDSDDDTFHRLHVRPLDDATTTT